MNKIERFKMLYYFILLTRLVTALFIFVSPIFSLALGLFLDYIDGFFAERSGIKTRSYQLWDKSLDFVWYTASIVFVILNFENRNYVNLLIALYIFRMIGTVLFTWFNSRALLVIFANYYENLLIIFLLGLYVPVLSFILNPPLVWILIFIAVVLKIAQEMLLHVLDFPFTEKMWGIKMHWKK